VAIVVIGYGRPGMARPGPAGDDRVALAVRDCSATLGAGVRRIVAIELGDLLLDESSDVGSAGHRLTVWCQGDLALVAAERSDSRERREHAFELGGFPGDAAPRALALAAIEVLAALSPAVRERIEARQDRPRPHSPQPEPRAVVAPPPPDRRRSIGLGASARTFLAPQGLTAWGGRLAFDREIGDRWLLGADFDVGTTATRDVLLGRARALFSSAGVVFGLRDGGARISGTVGLGARLGVVQLAGETSESSVTTSEVLRAWGGPVAAAGVRAGSARWGVMLSLEAGYAVIAAQGLAGGSTAVAASGPWLALGLGGAFRD
jgi:hypothetical protein